MKCCVAIRLVEPNCWFLSKNLLGRNMSRIRFTSLLLCSTAIISTPVMADASLDELKAKLEQAQKENIILKTEKIERENITMKLEQIQAENAALRNEAKVDKTPTASIPAQKTAAAPANPPSPEAKTIARREPVEVSVPTPREHVAARREINHALDNIPKDDTRREMTAAYKAPKDEVPIVVKQWQGVYAGINGGYGYGSQKTTTNGYGAQQNRASYTTTEPAIAYGYASTAYNGGFAGGQFGYNHQYNNNVVIGGEIDIDWADVSTTNASSSSGGASYQAGINGSNFSTANGRTGLNWLGTARMRVGYALGNFLPYITGGLAYGELDNNIISNAAYSTTSTNYNYFSGGSFSSSGSAVNVGWAAGAGAELMVAPNWSLKGEYLYTQLSGYNSYGAITSACSQTGNNYTTYNYSPTIFNTIHLSPFGVHQARVGLNYHTGWLGGGTPAVTAKY